VDRIIEKSKLKMDEIGRLKVSELTFENSALALDDLQCEEGAVMSRIHLLHNVSPDEEIRNAAEAAEIKYQEWAVEKAYHQGAYKSLSALNEKNIPLDAPAQKLLDEIISDYKRLGLHLPESTQQQLKQLQKTLAQIETEFSSSINAYHDEIWVDPSQLSGVDKNFISQLQKNESGQVRISLQYPEYLPIMEFCSNEEIRKILLLKKYQTAASENTPRLQKMVELRSKIANLLGYPSWNAFVLEDRMAKTPQRVFQFLEDFEKRLRPKANKELDTLVQIKKRITNNSSATLQTWDYNFFATLAKNESFQIDYQSLREFFPLPSVLNGLFKFSEKLFSICIEEKARGTFFKWHEDVRLYIVKDKIENRELGAFYLDLFPRKGKYGHAAAFSLIDGKLLPSGIYQRPVSAMVCNFSREGKQFLSHNDVETLFHEFGHILHGLLTWSRFSHFSGTSVAWDFVEAPSQILENWAWEFDVLKQISKANSKGEELSKDLVRRMNEAHKLSHGLFYLRQVSFSKADLTIHSDIIPTNVNETINRILSETFMPVPENTHFGAGFGHLVGYASGYYGYAWADVMAADMFSLFKASDLFNSELGLKLRREIYESGSERDENISLEKFLGRPLSSNAFFEHLGIQ
jgi:Zn-dependent oligopeptidase